jgi:hypothetical protein
MSLPVVRDGAQNSRLAKGNLSIGEQQSALNRQISFQTYVKETQMNSIIYIVGLVVVIIAVLSFFGLR